MFSKSIIWPTAVVFLFFYIVPFLFFYATEACFEEYVLIDVNRPDSEFKIGLLTFGVLLMSYAFVHVFQKWVCFWALGVVITCNIHEFDSICNASRL